MPELNEKPKNHPHKFCKQSPITGFVKSNVSVMNVAFWDVAACGYS
jgi:hypothetical protein